MASSLFTSFTNSPLRPTAVSPPIQRRSPAIVASGRTSGLQMSVGRSSLYEVLGIPMTASCREIKAAYRKLARICHPDVAAAENAADVFIKIRAAYSTLSDPDKRADYDRELSCRGQLVSVSGLSARMPVSGYSGYGTRRNWESDQCSNSAKLRSPNSAK